MKFPIRNNTPFLSVFVNEIISIKMSRLVHRSPRGLMDRQTAKWMLPNSLYQGYMRCFVVDNKRAPNGTLHV